MLSQLFKLALEKCNQIKSSAPDISPPNSSYFCKVAYQEVFSDMFELNAKIIISKNNDSDGCNYNNNITNQINMQRMCYRGNDKNDIYVPLNQMITMFLTNLDTMSQENKTYLEKLCDIILEDTYPIDKEPDNNIKIYYYLLKFIPLYFDVLCGCYNIFSQTERYNYCNEINKHIEKYNQNERIYVNGMCKYYSGIINIFKYNIDNLKELCIFIDEKYKNFNKLQKYKKDTPKKDKNNSEKKVIESIKTEEKPKTEEKTKTKAKVKAKIPAAVRKIVWSTYIGNEKSGKCLCCSIEEISNTNFECGHVKSEKNGGDSSIENLRPICGHCNKSVGSKNMDEFMDRYKIKKSKNWNGINTK